MTLHCGDCFEVMQGLPDNSVDLVLTDPPYGLSFMGKKWDYDVPSVEIWAEALRVLKPGGHLLAFAGTRTQHRMACRIEDAGFEIRDMLAWVYGSGFPKSLDVSKAIDKAAGAEREVGMPGRYATRRPQSRVETNIGAFTGTMGAANSALITTPATDAAREWQGWGTALKPALEPITMARKPLVSPCVNVLDMIESQLRSKGVNGEIIWKQENASAAANPSKTINSDSTQHSEPSVISAKNAEESGTAKTEKVIGISTEPRTQNGEQARQSTSGHTAKKSEKNCATRSFSHTEASVRAAENQSQHFSPSITLMDLEHGTEKQFTEKSTTSCEDLDSQMGIESFAGIATGLTGSMAHVHIIRDCDGAFLWPENLPKIVPSKNLTVAANVLEYGTGGLNIDACRVGTDDGNDRSRPPRTPNQILGGGKGTNLTASQHNASGRWPANLIHDGSEEATAPLAAAARFFYCAKASKRERDAGVAHAGVAHAGVGALRDGTRSSVERRNHHPTVKPIALMEYLCKLASAPGAVVLDPFMGSGTTGIACRNLGREFIGIERDADYFKIAQNRIEHTPQQTEIPA